MKFDFFPRTCLSLENRRKYDNFSSLLFWFSVFRFLSSTNLKSLISFVTDIIMQKKKIKFSFMKFSEYLLDPECFSREINPCKGQVGFLSLEIWLRNASCKLKKAMLAFCSNVLQVQLLRPVSVFFKDEYTLLRPWDSSGNARLHSAGNTMARSLLMFHNQPCFHANIQRGQSKGIPLYLCKSCLQFCKWNLNLLKVNKKSLINVSHDLYSQCYCLGKNIDYG